MGRPRKQVDCSQTLAEIIEQSRSGHDAGEMLLSIMDAFGGPDKMAAEFVKTFKSDTLGNTAKVKMIDTVMRLGQQDRKDKQTKTIARATDAELEEAAAGILRKIHGIQVPPQNFPMPAPTEPPRQIPEPPPPEEKLGHVDQINETTMGCFEG